MKRKDFKRPKMVLIFNGAKILIAITSSLRCAAELTTGNSQAISFCCTGRRRESGGYYFRHLQDDIVIELSDLGSLRLPDYDELCGDKRVYYSKQEMRQRRANKKNKSENQESKKEE